MKKLIALLLALMMVFAMVACGGETAEPEAPEADSDTTVTEEAVEEETPSEPEEEPEIPTEEEPEAEVTAPFDTALATDAVGFIYTPDFASLLLMIHPTLLETLGEEMLTMMAEEGNAQMQGYLDAFAAEKGETTLVIEAGEVAACSEEDLEAYVEMFAEYDLTVNAAVQVPVLVTNSNDGSIIGEHVMYFVEIDGAWYLDSSSLLM